MNQTDVNPALSTLQATNHHIDYSEVYRSQEIKQLNKRLRKVRNILLICAIIVFGGAVAFWILQANSFTTANFLMHTALSGTLVLLSFFSIKRPYLSILSAIIICIAFWAIEIFLNISEELLIEGSILKLIIISLLVTNLHTSKEAELIRKELHFS